MSSNFLSIHLRLSFFLLVFLNNSQNSVILSFIYLIMSLCHLFILLVIQVSSLIAISLFLNTFLVFLNHAFIIFVTSDAFEIPLIILQPVPLLLLSFILNLTIANCNSLLLNLPSTQTKRLQLVLNAAARAVTKTIIKRNKRRDEMRINVKRKVK